MESEPLKLDLRILAVRPGVAVVHRGEQGVVRCGVCRGVCRGVCVNDPPLPEFRAQCSTKRIKGGE